MKRILLGLAAMVLMTGAALADETAPAKANDADILSVVPESTLVAVVTKNAEAGLDHWYKMAVELGAEAPEKGKSPVDAVVEKLQKRDEDKEPLPASVDRKGPLAFVVVVPSFDVPGDPIALIFKVTDYKKFLDETAKIEGAAGPEVTPDGTDVIRGKKDSTYVGRLGAFVAVSPAEYVIRNLKADVEKNLAGGQVKAIRRLLDTSDVAAYANTDLVVKTFRPQINLFKTMMKKQMEQAGEAQGNMKMMGPLMGAYIDTLLRFGEETDAVCAGVSFSANGAKGTFVVQPVPETSVARLAAAVKPAKGDPLVRFDGPFIMAGSWDIRPELMAEVTKQFDEFVEAMNLPEDEQNPMKDFMESYRKLVTCLAGPGAFVWPVGEEKPMLRMIQVMEVAPGKDFAGAMQDYMGRVGNLTSGLAMGLKVKAGMEKKVETWRGVDIDKSFIEYTAPEDKADDAQTKMMIQMIRAMYGERMTFYTARVKDQYLSSLNAKDTAEIKEAIDRLLDGKKGNLVGSPAWTAAVAGLPAGRAATMAVSVEAVIPWYANMIAAMMGGQDLAQAKIEKPGAVGISIAPVDQGVVVDLVVPMQEMLNIKQSVSTMIEGMQGRFQQGGGAVVPQPGVPEK